jgi:DNA repair exonuclease SbcCD ATPase subunit
MGIRIKQITAKECGPIKELNHDFRLINLFYSKNEKGKSYIVEFIIQCLFKNKENWGYLRQTGKGKVAISGINKEIIDFSINKGKKIEDFLNINQTNLPPSLVNLLVVKEGESEIVKTEAGINRDAIKSFLLPRRILDVICNNIQPTIRNASIQPEIEIENRGIGKEYKNKLEEINKIDKALNILNSEFEQGAIKRFKLKEEELRKKRNLLIKAKQNKAYKLSCEIKELEEKLNALLEDDLNKLNVLINNYNKYKEQQNAIKKELDKIAIETSKYPELKNKHELLIKAKRYHAYLLSNKIKEKKEDLRFILDDDLNKTEQNISIYYSLKKELENRKKLLEEAKNKSKDYDWLIAAKNFYNSQLNTSKIPKKWNIFVFITSFVSLISAIFSITFNYKIVGILLILICFSLIVLYVFLIKRSILAYKQSSELKSIKEEYKKRFNESLENITQLDLRLEEQQKYKSEFEHQEKEVLNIQKNIEGFLNAINEGFNRLKTNNILEAQWRDVIINLKQKKENLNEELNILNSELAQLDVDESEYELHNPNISFDKSEFKKVSDEITRLQTLQNQINIKNYELNDFSDKLENIKLEIKQIFKRLTNQNVEEDKWEQLFYEIKTLRQNIKEKIESKRGELKGLEVSENEYNQEEPKIEYSFLEMKKVDDELAEINQKIYKEEERLSSLKTNLITITQSDSTISWNELIEKVYQKSETAKKELERLKAKIISEKLVFDIICEFQSEEDKKLNEVLNSKELQELLLTLTGRYKNLFFIDKEIFISDGFNDFNLKDLSTGAKEQVMLALRIGFLKHILNQESAFLILDDAFQHSDYEKRENMVNKLFELADTGWQIIYFTMDDHIKSLFESYCKKYNKNSDFDLIEL